MSRVLRAMPNGSLLMLVLFVSVLLSAIAVAYCAHWNRQLLNELYGELSVRDKAQAEWGRLILEQSTWTAHSRIETLATEQLRMHIPAAADVRLVRLLRRSRLDSLLPMRMQRRLPSIMTRTSLKVF